MPDLKRVAVVGGGINGIMIAWTFVKEGNHVDLYEKNTLMAETSRASSKMLHGGIRYLEQGHFGLVREALQERAWWLKQAPDLTTQFELLLPVYRGNGRSKWILRLGTALYDVLACGSGFPKGRWYKPEEVLSVSPGLKEDGLIGACSYWDGQMDDYALGLWAAEQASNAGVSIHEESVVSSLNPAEGSICVAGTHKKYDLVINASGPWAKQLLVESAVQSEYSLDLVQGTHILVNGKINKGCVLQVPKEKRIVFVLPYKGQILIGTTERKIENADSSGLSGAEVDYLLDVYNQYFTNKLSHDDVLDVFFGVRPIVSSVSNYSKASRESCLEKNGKLINVFGGKWTTSRSLARSVLSLANQ